MLLVFVRALARIARAKARLAPPTMPTTRSASRSVSGSDAAPPAPPAPAAPPSRSASKRKVSDATGAAEKAPRKRVAKPESAPAPAVPFEIPPTGDAATTELLPAKLPFSFEDAKRHLIAVDARFGDVFARLPCKPYEKLERVEPFRCAVFETRCSCARSSLWCEGRLRRR
jgi:DNA-3-methyladenine glycosylase II